MKNFEEKTIKDLALVTGGQNNRFEVTAEVEEKDGETWAKADFRWVQNASKSK